VLGQAVTYARSAFAASHFRQRGLSVVELMVGLTVGLLIMAGAAVFFANQVHHTRRSVIEARLQQDLRAATALLVRDLRRAGHWQAALHNTQWPAKDNPYRELAVTDAQQTITYHYSRDHDGENNVVDAHEQFGFRVAQQVLYARAGTGQWQSLTDRQQLRITRLQFAVDGEVASAQHACLAPCSDDACPQAVMRLVRYDIEAQATPPHADVRQRLQGAVRVRNHSTQAATC
jgi:type II secretory pathway component PulJ